ncbi:PepSY-associated TM helix domain-containing protein [Pararobbsia silviterrae]|uniref:PepSY domain-containing protein n=1 Tax=Pararobbsia silviterrae TaxID=1792498 RepID=A0A494X5X9_9BURK|nr:PepSY-associated TM helix domain-containing protein [Pararobbsia silviterrae]RKP45051.1 PepSY domain-containing protein [Pararobbsia silviterrae]
MRSSTLRGFQWLHTWAGICASFMLFIAFVGGTLTMFHDEIERWERPASRHFAVDGGPAQRLVGTLVALHPMAADNFGIVLANATHREPYVYWSDGADWQEARLANGGKSPLDKSLGFDDFTQDTTSAAEQAEIAQRAHLKKLEIERRARNASAASAASAAGHPTPLVKTPPEPFNPATIMVDHDTLDLSTTPGVGDFVDRLHYSLALPEFGLYVMGIVSLMFGVALVTGLMTHLPRLSRDLFALRPGSNLKMFWQDAHNAVGVLALPFHAVIAITGCVLCLGLVAAMLFNTIAFNGELMDEITSMRASVPAKPVVAVPGAPMNVDGLVAHARAANPDFTPRWIAYVRYGADDGTAEVWGDSDRALGSLGSVLLRLNDGAVLAQQTASTRDANHTVSSAIYGLHFGSYGGVAVRWIYFVLGITGAVLVYTGNLLWIEARRKRAGDEQPLSTRHIARATVAVCIGSCAGIAFAFDMALLVPSFDAASVYLTALLGAVVWSIARAPVIAARDLLVATAVCSALVPVLDALLTSDNLFHSLRYGDWQLAGIDLAGLAFAALFATLAVFTHRRGRDGDPKSVWATPSNGPVAALRKPSET